MSTISNTAQVLSIFRAGGLGPQDEPVAQGIAFLCSRRAKFEREQGWDIPIDLDLELSETRCLPYTRYFAWVLIGMTEFPRNELDRDAIVAIDACRKWLLDRRLRKDGGWLRLPGTGELSLLQTSTAVFALARHERWRGRSPDQMPAIRDGLEALRGHRNDDGGWPLSLLERQDQVSPAQTALCALAFNSLDDAGPRAEARAAAEWLLERADAWTTTTEVVDEARGTPQGRFGATWRHMSWALGLTACLEAGISISQPKLRPALKYLDTLWYEAASEWRDGHPGADPTVRATYAAVQAAEAMRRALAREDPLEIASALNQTPQEPGEPMLRLLSRPAIALGWEDADDQVEIRLTPRRWQLLEAIANVDGDGSPVAVERLVEEGRSEQSLRKEISRINAQVRTATDRHVPQLIRREMGEIRLLARASR
jgi:hypothetical protein